MLRGTPRHSASRARRAAGIVGRSRPSEPRQPGAWLIASPRSSGRRERHRGRPVVMDTIRWTATAASCTRSELRTPPTRWPPGPAAFPRATAPRRLPTVDTRRGSYPRPRSRRQFGLRGICGVHADPRRLPSPSSPTVCRDPYGHRSTGRFEQPRNRRQRGEPMLSSPTAGADMRAVLGRTR